MHEGEWFSQLYVVQTTRYSDGLSSSNTMCCTKVQRYGSTILGCQKENGSHTTNLMPLEKKKKFLLQFLSTLYGPDDATSCLGKCRSVSLIIFIIICLTRFSLLCYIYILKILIIANGTEDRSGSYLLQQMSELRLKAHFSSIK